MIKLKRRLKNTLKQLYSSPFVIKIRGVLFMFSEKLTGYRQLKNLFKQRTGYELDLKTPKSFNQKINWRKVHDRNPLLPVLVDKFKVREYIKTIIGEAEAEKLLIPLLYVTSQPKTIPFDELPDQYVIKANHGSGTNIIVRDATKMNRQKAIKECYKWLSMPYGFFKHEWAYKKVDRKIIVESLLKDEKGNIPKDYKFHIFHGKVFMIQVNEGLFFDKATRTLTLYTPKWERIEVFWEIKSKPRNEKPERLNEMIRLAERVAKDFDYLRVDLYSTPQGVFIGELTVYPTSGMARIKPTSFDFEVGKNWNIEPKYWKQEKR